MLSMHSDRCTPQYFFNKNFDVTIPGRDFWENQNCLQPDDILIFTDGSKTEERTGVGIFSYKPQINISHTLDRYASITQTETFAINEACRILIAKKISNKNIKICSDSQASLKALQSHCFTSKTTIECLDSVTNLARNNKVNLIWVPGHSNVEGNEKADSLAKEGSNTPFYGPSPSFGLTYSMQRRNIKEYYETQHLNLWKNLRNCNHSKTILNGPNKTITKYLLNRSRNDLQRLTGIITGHGNFQKHLHKIGLTQSPTCSRCNEEDETPLHLLMNCPAITGKRAKILKSNFLTADMVTKTKLKNILNFFNEIQI